MKFWKYNVFLQCASHWYCPVNAIDKDIKDNYDTALFLKFWVRFVKYRSISLNKNHTEEISPMGVLYNFFKIMNTTMNNFILINNFSLFIECLKNFNINFVKHEEKSLHLRRIYLEMKYIWKTYFTKKCNLKETMQFFHS